MFFDGINDNICVKLVRQMSKGNVVVSGHGCCNNLMFFVGKFATYIFEFGKSWGLTLKEILWKDFTVTEEACNCGFA